MAEFSSRMENMKATSKIVANLFEYVTDPEVIAFSIGSPSKDVIPIDKIREIMDDVITYEARGTEALNYGPILGIDDLHKIIAEELLVSRGIKDADPENILITVGGLEGINLLSQIVTSPGDTILVESPTFIQAAQIFDMFELNMIPVEILEDGIDVVDLEEKIKKYKPKMLYTVPTFQNPTGITTSLEKRKKVAELANKYEMFVLEDDPYREIRYSGEDLAPIKSFDTNGYVVYANSFSKIFSPGMRLGYVYASKEIIGHMWNVKLATNSHTAILSQVLAAEFFKRGYYEEHREMLCDFYRERRDAMCESIDEFFPEGSKRTSPDGGLFVWIELPEGINTSELQDEARFTPGVKVMYLPGELCYPRGDENMKTNCLRLTFGAFPPDVIREGVKRLGDFLKAQY